MAPPQTREGWWITGHAARMMRDRGFTRNQVLDCLESPEQTYCSHRGYPRWQYRHTYQRGNIAVVVDVPRREVVTVLYRQEELWGDQAVDQP